MAFVSKFTGPEIDRRLAQGTYDDAVAAGFTGTKEQFDAWIAAYTPEEMEKLNNKQDKEDPMLETENKTVVGAINLLNSEKQDKEDERLATESKIVVDAINELNTRTTDLYYSKQDKEDSGLATEQKTIVGAINELKLELQDQDSQKQDKVDDGFATNDKSVVGAVNEIHNELDTHVADYNKHADDYEQFKSDTQNTLNSHSTQIGQLTQEKQDKTDFNLTTESKTVVSAINENYAAINAEVTRAVAEDARLEEVKVPYTDISDSSNPDRKTIMLKNHDSLSGYGTDGTTAYNLAMVSKWDKADFGAAGIPININGSETHPTYNDKEELAFVSELSGETGKLAEDIKTLNETIATVNQNLADSVSALNKNMVDGFNTLNGGINNEIRPAIEKNAKDIGVVNETLTADINYLKPRVTTLESLQIVKVDTESENYSASYELQDATGKAYGQRINIATDKFIKSVSYANQVLTIVFVLEDGSESTQTINMAELMNLYTAGGGITISETGVISIDYNALQMIQYADSEVRRLETAKIPYAYDEKTQSNINVILPEGGSYLGNYGDENATVAKAAVYDGIKQLELGSSKVHTNINSSDKPTVETPDGKETLVVESDIELMPKEIRIPIRTLKDKVYTQEEILGWFGIKDIVSLKKIIAYGGIQYVKYGLSLSTNPHYYKMPVEYVAFESANQIKLVFVGLNTSNDVASKYEMIMNLDGIIIEGNSNVKLTITSIESGDIDLSEYATKEELNDYALKSELPDVSELVTQTELASKQNVLISGTTIRTLNGVSLLGSGDIQFEEGSGDYTNISNKPSINGVELSGNKTSDDLGLAAKSDIPDVSEFVKESELPTQYIVEEGAALQAGDEQHEFNIKSGGRVTVNSNNEVVTYTPYPGETGRKMLVLANNDSLTGTKTDGTGAPLAFMSKWDKIEIGNSTTSLNLNSLNGEITINDDKILATVDQIQAPYEINLTNLLSAEDSESISTAIGGINNLNATVQDNRIIVGTISNGSVSVSIRILGNVTTLYYLLDSVLGLTLNEVAITNTSGTLSKSVTTHSVLTENMVINSLNSDETTLPLSAAQGKALNNKIDSIDVSADITNAINALDSSGQTTSAGEVISSVSQENGIISVSKKTLVSDDIPEIPQSKITNLSTDITAKQNKTDDALNTEDKTIVGAINEIFPKATGVGQKFNNGTGEIFNNYDTFTENRASGNYSHAEGYATNASGDQSHAEGRDTSAVGTASHAEGMYSKSSGGYSHAEGYRGYSEGDYSHAEGYYTVAYGEYSHTEGKNTYTNNECEHAQGKCNKSNGGDSELKEEKTIHSIGIGESADNRKNAQEVMGNGDHYIIGIGNYDGTNPKGTNSPAQTLQEVVNGKQDTLVSGTSIKTINGQSLLGSGDIEITSGSSEVTWDNVTGKPSFATVATSGSYSDLTGTPDLSSYQTKSDDTLTTTDKTVVGAINELLTKIQELETKNQELESRLAALEGSN